MKIRTIDLSLIAVLLLAAGGCRHRSCGCVPQHARNRSPGGQLAAVPSIGRATRVERPVAHDVADAGELYERYAGQIFGYCFHQLGSREEAEDAVQEALVAFLRSIARYRGECDIETYLFALLRRKIIDAPGSGIRVNPCPSVAKPATLSSAISP